MGHWLQALLPASMSGAFEGQGMPSGICNIVRLPYPQIMIISTHHFHGFYYYYLAICFSRYLQLDVVECGFQTVLLKHIGTEERIVYAIHLGYIN